MMQIKKAQEANTQDQRLILALIKVAECALKIMDAKNIYSKKYFLAGNKSKSFMMTQMESTRSQHTKSAHHSKNQRLIQLLLCALSWDFPLLEFSFSPY